MAREGKGIGTVSFRKEHEEEEVDGVELEGEDEDELENIMWESDGVG